MLNREKLIREFIDESGWTPEEAPKFADWYIAVDRELTKQIGLGIWDIGDWCYADSFEDGMSPKQVAREVIALFKRGEL